MANRSVVRADIAARYEVHEWRNGLAILAGAHADEWRDILEVLRGFSLLKSDVLKPGGSKGLNIQQTRFAFFSARLVGEEVRHQNRGGYRGAHRADPQGGLLQESRCVGSGVEQQGPVFRSRPQQ